MNREQAQSFYLNAVKAFVFIALFSPLVLSGAFYFPFIVVKTIFFQIAVECALFFYILLAVLDQRYAPKFDGLAKSVCAFAGVYVLASVLGADPARSFFGTYERMLSVINLAHFITLFFIVKAVFSTGKEWLALLRVFLGASALLSLYGAAQKIGVRWDFIYHANIDRVDATIGNAAFVAGYLIFSLFFALLVLAKDTNAYSRSFAFFSIALNIVIIYFTGTRGAALALGVGAIMLFAAYLFKKDISAQTKKNTLLSLGAIAAFILVAVFLLAGKEGALQYYKRFTSISLSDTTVKTRILAASSSWRGFMARPVLGWGPENYNLVFDKYYNPKIYPAENWFDHAHNIFFDIATTMGVVGLAAYFFLLGSLVRKGILHLRREGEFWVGMLVVTLVIVYFIQNLFVFDSLVTYLPFMLLLAFAGAGFPLDAAVPAKQKDGKDKKYYNPSVQIAVMLLPVFAVTMYYVSVRPALGSYYTVQALKSQGQAGADEAIADFTTAISYSNFGRHEIRGKLADYAAEFIYDKNQSDDDKKKIALYAAQEMDKTIQDAPLDFRNYLYAANFLGQANDVLAKAGVNAFQKADDILKRAQELGPDKQILYLQWVRVKFGLGDFTGAVPLLEKLHGLSPDMTEAQTKLAYAYMKLGEKDKALAIYHALTAGKVLSVQDYIDIAVGLAGAGDKQGAIAMAQKIAELDPTMKDKAQNFISSLK